MTDADFTALYGSHAGRAAGLAARLTHNRQDGEDIAQDAWVQLWRRRQDVRSPWAYLTLAIKHRSSTFGTKQRRRRELAEFLPLPLPAESAEDVAMAYEAVRTYKRPRTAPVHGRLSTYTNHACRCRPCKDANAAYQRGRKARLCA